MQEEKKFAFDISITFLASALTMLFSFIITVLIGRYLGADDLGVYRITITLCGIIILISAMGIPATMIKYVAEFKEDRNKFNQIVSSGLIISLFFGIGCSILFYLLSGVFAKLFDMPPLESLLKILSPVFPFALVTGALLGLLNGLRKMKKHAAGTIIQGILLVLVTVPLIYYGFGVSGAVIGSVLSSVASCAFLLWLCRDYIAVTLKGFVQTARKLLKFGAQILGANAINMINYRADIVLIGYFLTATDVGYYAVALALSRFLWLIPNAIQRITYPATSEYWAKNNHKALQKMIDKSMRYTACILLPVGLGVGFFSREIITTIFGVGFIYAVLPLQLLIIGTVIFGVIKATGGSIAGIGRPDLGLKVVGISSATNILLNVIFIPRFGIQGAAIATTASLLVATLVGVFLRIKVLKVKIDFGWYAKLFGITVLSIFIFSIFRSVNGHLVGIILLSIYTIVIIVFFLTKEDLDYFWRLLQDLGKSSNSFI